MQTHEAPAESGKWLRAVYAGALHFYPSRFRQQYEAEMLRVFEEGLREAQGGGRSSTWHYFFKISTDLVASAARERVSACAPASLVAWVMAAVFSSYATYVDFHATEVQATLLVLVNVGFVLGCVQPRRAWLRAAAVAALLPTAHVIAFAAHEESGGAHPYLARVLIFCPAALFTFAGAYAGVLTRFVARKLV